jgi:hypothetical protein
MKLDRATQRDPAGHGMGLLMIGLNFIDQRLGGGAVPDPAGRGWAASWWCR